jgi:hypothetical protein
MTTCKHKPCGKKFKPKNWFQRFCSNACRNRAWRKRKAKKTA